MRDSTPFETTPVTGRLTHALTRRGLEALAGLVVAPRAAPQATQVETRAREEASRGAQPGEHAERAERERQARGEAAESALHEARATLARAEAAVAAATHVLGERQAERTRARDAVSAAQRQVEACG